MTQNPRKFWNLSPQAEAWIYDSKIPPGDCGDHTSVPLPSKWQKDWEVRSQVGQECGERHTGMGRVTSDGALG